MYSFGPAPGPGPKGALMLAKTVCPEHRRQGYAYASGVLVCRGCGLPAAQHETTAETVARKAAQDALWSEAAADAARLLAPLADVEAPF